MHCTGAHRNPHYKCGYWETENSSCFSLQLCFRSAGLSRCAGVHIISLGKPSDPRRCWAGSFTTQGPGPALSQKNNNNERSNICSLCLYFSSQSRPTSYCYKSLSRRQHNVKRSCTQRQINRLKRKHKMFPYFLCGRRDLTRSIFLLASCWVTYILYVPCVPRELQCRCEWHNVSIMETCYVLFLDFKTLKSMQTGYNDLVFLSTMFWRDLEGLFLSVTNLHSLP